MKRFLLIVLTELVVNAHLFAADDPRTYDQILHTKNKTVVDYFLLCPELSMIDGLVSLVGTDERGLDERKFMLNRLNEGVELGNELTDIFNVVVDVPNAYIEITGQTLDYGPFTLKFAYYERADKSRIPCWSLVLQHGSHPAGGPGVYKPTYQHRFYDLRDGDGDWKLLSDAAVLPAGDLSLFSHDAASVPCDWQVDIPRYGTVTPLVPRPITPEAFAAKTGSQDQNAYETYLGRVTVFMKQALQAQWNKAGARFAAAKVLPRSGAVVIAGSGDNQATVWRDGVLVTLPRPLGYSKAQTSAVVLGPQGELVAGIGCGPSGQWLPILWREGVPTVLSLPGTVGEAAGNPALRVTGVASDGTAVYITANLDGKQTVPLFWKDSSAQVLHSPTGEGSTVGVAIFGGAVWVGGNVRDVKGGKLHAGFWKDGIWNALSDDSKTGSSLTAMTGGAHHVYFAGYPISSDELVGVGTLWDEQGTTDSLPLSPPADEKRTDSRDQHFAIGLVTGDGVFYVTIPDSFDSPDRSLLWHDGKSVPLPRDDKPLTVGSATGIATDGAVPWVSGYSSEPGEDGASRAGFWFDKEWFVLEQGSFQNTEAYGIAVNQ